ncbi:NACHT, LRR and PYD domains-containing protein 1a-like [Hyperolius riggenbachi]|uniref:NACHT, LRR and PYD domains-containing protein 1a-like n=1 Tax=Hyperolius riggenbachi TaxID=752182 RepID=UPI0035A331B8
MAESDSFVKIEEETDVITPTLHGRSYRLELQPERLSRCSETGIAFRVKSSVTIEYKLESGSCYEKQMENNGYKLVGPLFNVKVAPGVVSSVYLPHYTNLQGLIGNKTMFKCGHFKNGKMNLETPSRIETSYTVLENPSFSCLGPAVQYSCFAKKPIDCTVHLYFRVLCPNLEETREYRLHVYLIPAWENNLEKLEGMKVKRGFKRLEKPFQINAKMYAGQIYKVIVKKNANVYSQDQNLIYKIHNDITKTNFAEVNIEGSAETFSVMLESACEGKELWEAKLTRGDLTSLTEEMAKKQKRACDIKRFLKEHHSHLVARITNVSLVVDELYASSLLEEEQVDLIRSRPTTQEQMRELLKDARSWGKEERVKFYQALEKHNGPVIKHLQRGS